MLNILLKYTPYAEERNTRRSTLPWVAKSTDCAKISLKTKKSLLLFFSISAYFGPRQSKSNKGNVSFICSCYVYTQLGSLARWAQERRVHQLAYSWAHRLWSHSIEKVVSMMPAWPAPASGSHYATYSTKSWTQNRAFSLQSLLAHRASYWNALRPIATEKMVLSSQHADALFLHYFGTGKRVMLSQPSATHPCHFLAYFTADSGTSTELVHLLQGHILKLGCP